MTSVATRATNALCMGITLAVAATIATTLTWLSGESDVSELALMSLQPLVAFAAGVGIRSVGSIVIRGDRLWMILIGDVIAALVAAMVFALVASLNDSAMIVQLATIIVIAVFVPLIAMASLVSTWVSRSRSLFRVACVAGLCILFVAVALQGTRYWS